MMLLLSRRATVFDVGALVALRAEMFRVTGTAMTDGRWRSNAHRWFTERVKNPIYGIFVVQAGQDVVACAMGAVRDAAPSPEVPTAVMCWSATCALSLLIAVMDMASGLSRR